MSHFLNALRGENGELQRIKAKQIVRFVRGRIISAGEAAEEFFGNESDVELFMLVMRILSDKKRGGAIHRILKAASAQTITTERAIGDLIIRVGTDSH